MRNTLRALKKAVLKCYAYVRRKFINNKPMLYKLQHLLTTYLPTLNIFFNKYTMLIIVLFTVVVMTTVLFPVFTLETLNNLAK